MDDSAKMTDPKNNVAISMVDISKRYWVYKNRLARLCHLINPSNTKDVSEFWALQNINLEIKRGESLAIIGRNGAGKSTLLQIISETLTPTTGTVHVNGRVAALLELGSGFNPHYTGRENIVLNGLLLGLSRKTIQENFDNISSFADIGDVLDKPVKTYSSGMLARLAFSVQIALEPDILIVDEALSVGDYFFQQKCFARLRQMREDGLTLLLVSHDMSTVRYTCDRALYLYQGSQVCLGDTQDVVRKYFKQALPVSSRLENAVFVETAGQEDAVLMQKISDQALWAYVPNINKRLRAVHMLDTSGRHITSTRLGSTIVIRVYLRMMNSGLPLTIGVQIKNKYNQIISSTNNQLHHIEIIDRDSGSISVFEFEIDMNIEAGQYSVKLFCADPLSDIGAREDSGWLGPIRIDWDYEYTSPPFFGMFGLPVRAKILVEN